MCLRSFGILLCIGLSLIGIESGLRVVPYLVGDPIKSLVEEAQRIPKSNVRVYAGFRGGTRILLPGPGEKDLLVVGDSMAFGTYVAQEDIFANLLAKRFFLRVVNLAIGSQSTPEYNRMLEVGKRYHPKIVLYCMFANDFGVSTASPSPDDALFIETLNPWESAAHVLKRITNLSLAYQLFKVLEQPSAKSQVIPWKDAKRSFFFASKEYWDPQVSFEHPSVKKAFALNLENARAASAMAKAMGASFSVVLLPSKEMVYGSLIGDKGSLIFHPLHEKTFSEFEKGLNRLGIPSMSLLQPLRNKAEVGQKLYHSIDGHFSEEGHRAVAEVLGANLAIVKRTP